MLVFAYGSLLSPASLAHTLPDVEVAACRPVWCDGWERGLGVAFPNDGSQTDKEYRDDDGARPSPVLFWDIRRARARVNGVCIPVDDAGLAALVRRERRYDATPLRAGVHDYLSGKPVEDPVVAFVGRTRYRAGGEGVVAASYLESTLAGARHWDDAAPGFLRDFVRTTRMPEPRSVVPLARIDRAAADEGRSDDTMGR